MRLALVRRGGVAGMARRSVVETREGTPQDAEIRRLVHQAELPRFSESTLRTGPDRMRYTLTVEDGDAHHSVTFDEENTPEAIRPLMEAIVRHASTADNDPEATKA
ncbi:MAG: protealysin inhibitor emfourin [Acidobacteriota bacterium]